MAYYTTKGVCEKYNLNEIIVRRWLKSGKLKSIKVGHQYRISQENLDEFITKSK